MLGDPNDPLPAPVDEPYGFDDSFASTDDEGSSKYNRDTHPVWEYDAGGRGQSDWRRYPARIEESLSESPRFMYRPSRPDCD